MIHASFIIRKKGGVLMPQNGIIIYAHEVSRYWEDLMIRSGLQVLGLHPTGGNKACEALEAYLAQTKTPEYMMFCENLREKGIAVTLECHALSWLLPRSLFAEHPDWFRMNEEGERVADVNMCPSNPEALAYVQARTAELVPQIPADDGKYRLWIDDTRDRICHCEKCKNLSGSDQAMLIYNAMQRGVRQVRPKGKIAYLAYYNTLEVPAVKPENGIFLEYAPIARRFDKPIYDPENGSSADTLKALLNFFGKEDSEVLEYWMDNSLFCKWKLPYKKLELNTDVLVQDVAYYRALGFEFITSFGCFLNADYAAEFGEPPVETYGKILSEN